MHEAKARYRAIVDLAEGYLDAVARTPVSEARAERELTLRTARARALMALEGYTERVELAYEEALGPIRAEGTSRARSRSCATSAGCTWARAGSSRPR